MTPTAALTPSSTSTRPAAPGGGASACASPAKCLRPPVTEKATQAAPRLALGSQAARADWRPPRPPPVAWGGGSGPEPPTASDVMSAKRMHMRTLAPRRGYRKSNSRRSAKTDTDDGTDARTRPTHRADDAMRARGLGAALGGAPARAAPPIRPVVMLSSAAAAAAMRPRRACE